MQLIRKFSAQDNHGNSFMIEEWATVRPVPTLQNPGLIATSLPTFRLIDGSPVNPTDDPNTFEIVATGVLVSRVY